MFKFAKIAVVVSLPLLCSGVALAQTSPSEPAAPMPHRMGMDFAAMHKTMCADAYARHAGRLAFLEAKLELTDQQRPVFAKWKQAVLDGVAKEKAACLEVNVKPETPPTAPERMARLEKDLATKLQTLQNSRPAFQTLYDSLTPAQRMTLDRSFGAMMRHAREERAEGGHPRGGMMRSNQP
jgi:hypothetical protein